MQIRIVLYGIKQISSAAFEFEKKTTKNNPLKTWNAKCNKTITALNVVQYDVLHNTSYRTQLSAIIV